MTPRCRSAVLTLLLGWSTGAHALSTTVPVGWLEVLDAPGTEAVTLEGPAVAQVSLLEGGQVLIRGLAPGLATLTLWGRRDGRAVRRSVELGVQEGAVHQPHVPPLVVVTGVEHPLSLPGLRRVEVGDAGRCGVERVAGGLVLHPLRAGTTTLVTWSGGLGPQHRRVHLVVAGAGLPQEVSVGPTGTPGPLSAREGLVELRPGEEQDVDLPGLLRIAAGPGDAASFRVSAGHLRVRAHHPGQVRVVFWPGQGSPGRFRVVVREAPPEPVFEDVAPAVPAVVDARERG